jgi:hypothetical protein
MLEGLIWHVQLPLLPAPLVKIWTSTRCPAAPYHLPFQLIVSLSLSSRNCRCNPHLRLTSGRAPRCRPLLPPQRNRRMSLLINTKASSSPPLAIVDLVANVFLHPFWPPNRRLAEHELLTFPPHALGVRPSLPRAAGARTLPCPQTALERIAPPFMRIPLVMDALPLLPH